MAIFRIAATAASLALASSAALAQGIGGSFKGIEKLVLSNCGSYDGTTTTTWTITFAELKGGAYGAKGETTSGGSFKGEGKFSEGTATGNYGGINRLGKGWSGSMTAVLDGDKLAVQGAGEVFGTGCKFVSEVEAVRQP